MTRTEIGKAEYIKTSKNIKYSVSVLFQQTQKQKLSCTNSATNKHITTDKENVCLLFHRLYFCDIIFKLMLQLYT